MSELTLLRLLLLASMIVGPLGTHRWLLPGSWRTQTAIHAGALSCAAIGLYTPASPLCIVWLLYCAASFARFVHARRASLRSPAVLAACVPFVFSNVAAVWLVGGANDLHILGYGAHFSFYAALHGNVLGWSLLGSFAILADRGVAGRRLYIATVFACLPAFLLIALGIDQLRPLKRIGVVGLSIVLPVAQLVFVRAMWPRSRRAFVLGCISFACLAVTMVLAWRNELAMPLRIVGGIREMVSVHGVLNAVVVAPCFLAAVLIGTRR